MEIKSTHLSTLNTLIDTSKFNSSFNSSSSTGAYEYPQTQNGSYVPFQGNYGSILVGGSIVDNGISTLRVSPLTGNSTTTGIDARSFEEVQSMNIRIEALKLLRLADVKYVNPDVRDAFGFSTCNISDSSLFVLSKLKRESHGEVEIKGKKKPLSI